MPLLRTARLILRDFNETDLDALAALTAKDKFMRFSGGAALSREQTAAILERIMVLTRANLPAQFALTIPLSGQLLGYCGFFLQHVDEVDEIEIAYRLDPDFWGGGLATEAARAVRNHAFTDLALKRVISLIHPDNIASRRVAEKTDMTFEKQTTFRGFPTLVFAALAPELEAV
ncbi:MAG: GNAT family N-acetyltransferase [Chthoniobacterales bacterium]